MNNFSNAPPISTLSSYALDAKNVIIRMPNWLGDVVNATVVLEQVRHLLPNATITAMAQDNVIGVLQEHPCIDAFFSYQKPNSSLNFSSVGPIIKRLKAGKFDLGILLPNSFASAIWFRLGNVRHRIGFAHDLRSFLLNDAVEFPTHRSTQHIAITYQAILSPGHAVYKPRVVVTEQEIAWAKERLAQLPRPLIGINPSSAFGPAKNWLPERFTELIQRLEQKGYSVVVFGDEASLPLCTEICANTHALNLAAATNLRQLMACLTECRVVVSGDSGPLHLADALGQKVIALFGSTDPAISAPLNNQRNFIYKPAPCSPCHQRECPIDFPCMKAISTDEVFDAIEKQF